jgi:hypothetical protein
MRTLNKQVAQSVRVGYRIRVICILSPFLVAVKNNKNTVDGPLNTIQLNSTSYVYDPQYIC